MVRGPPGGRARPTKVPALRASSGLAIHPGHTRPDPRAGGDEQAGVGVAQVVESEAWDVGAGEVPVEELADRFGMHRQTLDVEDRFDQLDGMTVTVLTSTPSLKDRCGGRVEIDAIEMRCVARCQSPQRSPTSSPQRMLVVAARCRAG